MNNDVVIYQSSDGLVKMEAVVDASNETIWATQKAMAQLFGVNVSGISRHLVNVFSSGELDEKSNLQKMQIAKSDKPVAFYSLDVIISVGYRVNSIRATAFRQWATSVLKQYMIKGYAVNHNAVSEQKYGLTFGEGKSQTRTERLRPNERTRYEMANDVKSALKDSHSWKDFFNNLKAYGINAQIKFSSGTHIPQGISFTRDVTTFKGSSLDRNLSFSKIDKVLTGGVNIETGGQAQDHSAYESRSNDQDHSLTTDLSMLAADLAIGLIASGQEKKSEEQDFAPNKKRGPRL